MNGFEHILNEKGSHKFSCKKCNYSTSKKSQWERHCDTMKHKRIFFEKKSSKEYMCECGKQYKARNGLFYHKKKCSGSQSIIQKNTKVESIQKNTSEQTELIMQVLTENKELRKTIQELIPKVGNNNNNTNKFNLNFFLNEQCKNAMNLTDFVESLQIQCEDLQITKQQGLIEGISSIFSKGLKGLDMYQRPIHCTDAKRAIIYVKDEDIWAKDQQNQKLKETVQKVSKKQIMAIKDWSDAHPDWSSSEKLTDEYMKIVREATDEMEGKENKIIKTVTKDIMVEKDDFPNCDEG